MGERTKRSGKRKHIRCAMMTMFVLLVICLTLTGCSYVCNRLCDFADIFQLGVGVSSENPKTGLFPPSLGVHVQATEFLNLGALHFSGYSAEWDGRGFFAGEESRTRIGFLPFQAIKIDQNYTDGIENYFKKDEVLWTKRMNSTNMRWLDSPAKELNYEFWAYKTYYGAPLFHRGWQYWENVNVEAGICEPFVTHLGLNVRAGFDVSEVSDWLLGFFLIDYKQDDLTAEEFTEKTGMRPGAWERKPPSD